MEDYPKEIMRNIYWAFDEKPNETVEGFKEHIKEYYKEIEFEELNFNPEEIVLPVKSVSILYSRPTRGGDMDDDNFRLEADNESGFKVAELLFKIHLEVYEKLKNADHIFFEGLTLLQEKDEDFDDTPPLYILNQGS